MRRPEVERHLQELTSRVEALEEEVEKGKVSGRGLSHDSAGADNLLSTMQVNQDSLKKMLNSVFSVTRNHGLST